MKRILLLAVVLAAFTTSAFASPWPCDCVGGFNPYTTPTFWYMTDYFGEVLEDGDCVCIYWVGPDGIVQGPDPANPPEALPDDVRLEPCDMILFGGFYFSVTTWQAGAGVPGLGDFIYAVVYDGPCDQLGPSNYYGVSTNLHAVANYIGETAFFLFPGDPGAVTGNTDTHVPVELTSFEAIARDGEVLLEWKTASESDVLGFYVERGDVRSDLIQAAGNSEVENIYTYVDKSLDNGVSYSYNLITVDMNGKEVVANSEPVSATPMAHVPTAFALHQNYPNPFNPVTEIKYDVPTNAHVTLKVFNVLGAEVATLVDADQNANFYTVSWDAKDLASGVYFCTLTAGDFKAVKKMVLLK
jgi:hypothetical protein